LPNILAALAEIERDLLVKRTQSGLARVNAEGKTLCGSTSTTNKQRAALAIKHQVGELISILARTLGVFCHSITRIVKPASIIRY
jgi:putative DNA-invertase from lambdoid prophage Rac